MPHDKPHRTPTLGFLCWQAALLGLVALCVLSPSLLSRPGDGLQLGTDVPLLMLQDSTARLTVDEVAALPDSAFTPLRGSLNQGYGYDVYWLRAPAPVMAQGTGEPLWLEVMPPYLDKVTLYQPDGAGGAWRAHHSGDTEPMAQRMRVRQLVFPLAQGQPLILRVQTLSAAHLFGVVRTGPGLAAWLSSVEWASGVHQGINLLLALLIGAAALALRMRVVTAMAVISAVVLVHSANVHGYAQLWLPERLSPWADAFVSVGVFVLPASFAWLARELLTRGTRWRRIDKVLAALAVAPLLAIAGIALDLFPPLASVASTLPWITCLLAVWVGWSNVRHDGPTTAGVLVLMPYTVYAVLGAYVMMALNGLLLVAVPTGTFWQVPLLLLNLMLTVSVGMRLLEQFQNSTARQAQLLESLAQSEHSLEERVRQRTAELLHAQNAVQAALHSEREMRLDQRQFFTLVNHEFRTPLAVIDSAATEQAAFPTPEIAAQVERAAQIHRACRRLTALVDNCLTSGRLDAAGFQLQMAQAHVSALAEEAAQIVRWSPRHQLRLQVQEAPDLWPCDPTLVHIALSNLVDNAVKYAPGGPITVAARRTAQGALELSVADEGPGLPPDAVQRIFEQFERGHRTDQTRGFGLGLWVARRVARLHGGEVGVESSPGNGTRFTLTLPSAQKP